MPPSVASSTPLRRTSPIDVGPMVMRAILVCFTLTLTSASKAADAMLPVAPRSDFGAASAGAEFAAASLCGAGLSLSPLVLADGGGTAATRLFPGDGDGSGPRGHTA